MGFGEIIGRLWRRRAERPAEAGATDVLSGRERPTAKAPPDLREFGPHPTVDEQAGDSHLGYTDN